MDISITPAPENSPLERVYVITATIKTFKGRRNVEAHLFRTGCDDNIEPLRGLGLVGAPVDPAHPGEEDDALRCALEAFTAAERDGVIAYLTRRYGDSLACVSACPMELPIPQGVVPLSAIPEGKTMGFIRFDAVNGFDAPVGFRGFYDLAEHEPLVSEQS